MNGLLLGFGVVPEASLGIGEAGLIVFTASPSRWHGLRASAMPDLGVPVVATGAPCSGKPNLPVQETLGRFNSSSLNPTHTTHVYTISSHSFTHSHSVPHCCPAGCHVGILDQLFLSNCNYLP